MASLNTQVDGDTGSVRAVAGGIGALGGGLDAAGAGFGSALSQSESQWSGSAGDAFRGKITSAHQATRLAVTATRQVHAAMHAFADQMDQVKAKMTQARSIASGAGLTVSGNAIEQPKPPAAPPNICYSPSGAAQVAAQFHAAVAKYKRQFAAYQKAEQIIKQARQEENQAHAALKNANNEAENLFTELKNNKYWIAGDTALRTAERGLGQAEKWAKKAADYAKRFNGLIDDLNTLPAGTEARLAQLSSASRALDHVVNAGDARDANKVLALGLDSRYSKFLAGAGYALSAAQIVNDVLHSKDRAQNIAGDVASTAVGAGGTELIGELSVGGALETGGLSLLAGGAAIGTGYLVKHYGPSAWDWANKQVGDLESSIEHALLP
ncbi:MAG TPA: hypothetical protein VEO01_37615 [Pseudonocardiaceae bacterium]|nr:hypothetical protein [Pseudonocardiaceae bacterium]